MQIDGRDKHYFFDRLSLVLQCGEDPFSLIIKMAISTEAPQQYKQPSRKGKKAWRKNVDVSDLQRGLEQVRDEAIEG